MKVFNSRSLDSIPWYRSGWRTAIKKYDVGVGAVRCSLDRSAHVANVPFARRGTARWFADTNPAVPSIFGLANATGGDPGALPPERERQLGCGGERCDKLHVGPSQGLALSVALIYNDVPSALFRQQWWQMQNLRKSLETARANGVEVRGIAVINPGNPTGNILAEEQIKDIIQVGVRCCKRACYARFGCWCLYLDERPELSAVERFSFTVVTCLRKACCGMGHVPTAVMVLSVNWFVPVVCAQVMIFVLSRKHTCR